MRIIEHIDALRSALGPLRADKRIGLVPTMGNLHDGHLALVSACRRSADVCVASIFVNPMQFGPTEDYLQYPRTPEPDRQRLADAGVDYLFTPGEEEMYPGGRFAQTSVHVPFLSGFLCGAARPGHFDGVATVVLKLLNIVVPHVAFFGEKDYQQLNIIRAFVRHLDVPVEIVGVPTVRAPDGLALSSRNQYLSNDERRVAPRLHEVLCVTRDALLAGRRDFATLERSAVDTLARTGFRPDYVAIRDAGTLRLPTREAKTLSVLGAAYLGRARLIDNVSVELAR